MKDVQNSARRNYLKVKWIVWNNINDSFDITDECESSESESDVEDRSTEIAADGTIWQETEQGSTPGRAPIYNIFREVVGSTAYPKRNIMKGKRLKFLLNPPRRIRRKHIFGDGSKDVQLPYEDDLRRTIFSSIDRVTAGIRERFQQLQNIAQRYVWSDTEHGRT
ncbi:uncharacterized protein TNCV_2545911 [Trichonephila clavipes]|nr:uncharacterized protein TNCV_2545911 [Trichonephila clavipes]